MPAFTGKSDSAVTAIRSPRMLLMIGVTTEKKQVSWTVTSSPSPTSMPSPFRSVKTGSGTIGSPPPVTGRSQLVADASSSTLFRYWVWTVVSGVTLQASGLLAASLAAIRAMFWTLM